MFFFKFKNTEINSFDLHTRFFIVRCVVVVVFVLLGVRFWSLQVVHHETYARQAENNRIRDILIPAPRGNILDRYGRILVDSRPTFSLMLNREDMVNKEETVHFLIDQFGIDENLIRKLLDSLVAKSQPIELKLNATDSDRAKVAAYSYEHPELTIELRPQRKYPLGEVASHVLGYVHEINLDQLAKPVRSEYENCKPGDKVGQAGLEKYYNQLLMGHDGSRRIVVDSKGRFIRELEVIPPIAGQDVVTTLDLDLQLVAEESLKNKGLDGTIVIMNPKNGEILTMVSQPGYDPNLFSEGISQVDYSKLVQNPHKPLRNRAIQDVYPPGSTWKLVMAVAGMKAGVMTPDTPFLCGGGIHIGNRFTRCMGSHGSPKISYALTKSCDGYFYRLGIKMGLESLQKWATEMGAGQYTGIDLPNEFKGYIPSLELKASTVRRYYPSPTERDFRWTDADSVNASIGQAMVRPTPLQMLKATAGISQHGVFHTPHLLLEARPTKDRPAIRFEDKTHTVDLSPSYWDAIIEGMWGAVNAGGTAAGSAITNFPGFQMCGKTGTAQVVSKIKTEKLEERDHSWFVAFGPRDNAEIAGISLVEHGGFGAQASAPNIKAVFETYLHKKSTLTVQSSK